MNWLNALVKKGAVVQADPFTAIRFDPYMSILIDPDDFPTAVLRNSYVVLGTDTVQTGVSTAPPTGALVDFRVPGRIPWERERPHLRERRRRDIPLITAGPLPVGGSQVTHGWYPRQHPLIRSCFGHGRHVRPHPGLGVVVDRTHVQVDGFESPKRPPTASPRAPGASGPGTSSPSLRAM